MKRVEKIFEYELPIKIVSQKAGGFVAAAPAWKDCYAQGETVDEAVLGITAVAQTFVELYIKERSFPGADQYHS